MKPQVNRRTVDLSAYPDLVVVYLGMRVNAITGLKTLIRFGPKISKSVDGHEAYFIRGRMEAVYIDIDVPLGFSVFAPVVPARGAMFSARRRLNLEGEPEIGPLLNESDLYEQPRPSE